MLNSLKTFGLILSILAIGCSDNSKYSNSVISSPHPLASETGKLIFQREEMHLMLLLLLHLP